jgi:predicted transcriptional regulator
MSAPKIDKHAHLTRRERQIMDVVYQRGQATAFEIIEDIPDPPSYSAIRALLAILERKGHLKHTKDGAKYVYLPMQPRHRAAQSAVKRMLQTFFGGSAEKAMAALLGSSEAKFSEEELKRMADMIEAARKENR